MAFIRSLPECRVYRPGVARNGVELRSYLTAIRRAGYPCIYGSAPRERPGRLAMGERERIPRCACVERTKCDDRRCDGRMGRAAPRSLGRRVRRGGENRAREARAWPCDAIIPGEFSVVNQYCYGDFGKRCTDLAFLLRVVRGRRRNTRRPDLPVVPLMVFRVMPDRKPQRARLRMTLVSCCSVSAHRR